MNEPQQETNEKLVRIHQARNEWEGNIIAGYLQGNGITATVRTPPELPPLNTVEEMSGRAEVNGIFVLEHQATAARRLLQEFLNTATDPQMLEAEAAQQLRLDRATIARLRSELREEKQTFEFLGWLMVVFLVAGAVLWAIWPAWLKMAPPGPVLRWLGVVALALCAVFVGSWMARRLKD